MRFLSLIVKGFEVLTVSAATTTTATTIKRSAFNQDARRDAA
jgi:hypothetical protein